MNDDARTVKNEGQVEVPVNEAQMRILRAANQRYLQKKQEAELARQHVEELKAVLAAGMPVEEEGSGEEEESEPEDS